MADLSKVQVGSDTYDVKDTYAREHLINTIMSKAELIAGTVTDSRVVRPDYLKEGIEDIIDNNTHSIPSGGTSNQVLAKNSNTDYDTKWASAAVIDDSSTTTNNVWSASKIDTIKADSVHTHTKSDITDFPTLGTASAKDVPASGNASNSQVVMGNDTRLTDARTPTSHTHDDRYYTETETNTKLATKQDKTFLTCSTARNVKDKVVAYTGFTLTTGAEIVVKFTDTTTTNPESGNLTLNVNNTGAKEIKDYVNNATLSYTSGGWFCSNRVCLFVYDGNNWVYVNRDANTTYTGATLKTASAKTGSGTTITSTVAASTTMDNAIGTLLNNDVALNTNKANKSELSGGTFYGVCNGQASNQNKVVTVDSSQYFELKIGCIVAVKFDANNTYNATAEAPVKLNVNNSGNIQIYYNASATNAGTNTIAYGTQNRYIYYMYDGTYWVWMNIGFETTYGAMSASELTTGTATYSRVVRADYLKSGVDSLIDAKVHNMATGGTTNQVLAKNSSTDYDTKWINVATINDSTTSTSSAWSSDKINTSLSDKAPTNHRSAETTYGVGNASYYGHVKVDSALSTSSTNPVRNSVVTNKFAEKISTINNTNFAGVINIEVAKSGSTLTDSMYSTVAQSSTTTVNKVWTATTPSDSRIKRNIKDSSVNALDVINNLEPKEFDFIDKKYGKHTDLGYIAQNVEKYIPEAVIECPQSIEHVDITLKTLAYERIVPYLIKAIQEQQQQIQELQEEVNQLKEEK